MCTPAERLIRLVPAPVLVVKRVASGSYARVFVSVDLRQHCELLLSAGVMLARGSSMAVFHSLSRGSGHAGIADADARPLRAQRAHRACESIAGLLAPDRDAPGQALAHGPPPVPVVAFGPAGETILAGETAHRPDLIVIGNRRRGLFAKFLLGGVTQQVLAQSDADVLVVPLPPELAQAPDPAAGEPEAAQMP
jgi:nucleotide-binding universal stress UspA family protein